MDGSAGYVPKRDPFSVFLFLKSFSQTVNAGKKNKKNEEGRIEVIARQVAIIFKLNVHLSQTAMPCKVVKIAF